MVVQVRQDKKRNPISKITEAKKAIGVTQGIEHLSSNVSTVPQPPPPKKQLPGL
jgi:hypothetical protein